MDLKCECGKLVGRYENDTLYLYCKKCKKEIEIKLNNLEPKSQDKNI